MRNAIIERNTNETEIDLSIVLDGSGKASVDTGIGFLNHMLTLFAKHSGCDVSISVRGDLEVDAHHTTEDIGIALGQGIREALGDKRGIHRYGDILLPMDEVLMMVALDFSGRPYFVWEVELPQPKVGAWDSELAEDFFRAMAMNAGLTLHIRMVTGANTHHIIEAAFKAFARALRIAMTIDPREPGIPSTKGMLD